MMEPIILKTNSNSLLQPDELTFTAGDILYVYDQVTDKDWWKARSGNKTGVIPSNYGR